ncbi:MAG: tRNA pseudouridine(38-40) synthase TruA [Eubacteriales bacterium]
MRVKVVVEYDGANYSGWQRQINSNSIQQTIEECLFKLTGNEIVIHGAGRTDAGVHAFGQVFHFDDDTIPPERYAGALNSKLPHDIRAISSEQVDDEFHSRFDAKGKRYQYKIDNQKRPIVIKRNYAWRVYKEIDIEKMKSAASDLLGEHDFSSFMAARSFVQTTVREIESIKIEKQGSEITIDIVGNGFLRSMVRIIAGTLVEMGTGQRDCTKMKEIIAEKNRLSAGITAPAGGLYLMEIYY